MGGARYRQGTEFRSQGRKGPREILDAFKSNDMEEQELNESASKQKVNDSQQIGVQNMQDPGSQALFYC